MYSLSADNSENIEFIVNKYGDALYRICYVMLQNESDAEDVVQETFVKYLEKKPHLSDFEHTKAWLVTVAKNKCRDMLRYRQKHPQQDVENLAEVSERKADSGVLDCLTALPDKFRLVLMLYYVEEYKIEEIARIIRKTPSAVKMRLKKGRHLLSEKYKREVLSDD